MSAGSIVHRLGFRLGRVLTSLAMAGAGGWGGLALWFDGSAYASPLAVAFVAGGLLLPLLVRSLGKAVVIFVVAFAALLAWWLAIPASNDRDWQPNVARLASASIDGSLITLHNVRNFEYGDDGTEKERWETRTYDLDDLIGVDLFISYWGPRVIAHTIASWEFKGGRHLAISIETRKEKGETYSAVKGFFRQFEIYYVVTEERDVIGVRAKQRGEQVYLYRLTTPVALARKTLLDYLGEIDRLNRSPQWYNALVHNCTTTIRHHAQHVSAGNPWNWRILANGFIDELGYARGTVDTNLPFAELRRRSDVTERAKAAAADASFSTRIRTGLPGNRDAH